MATQKQYIPADIRQVAGMMALGTQNAADKQFLMAVAQGVPPAQARAQVEAQVKKQGGGSGGGISEAAMSIAAPLAMIAAKSVAGKLGKEWFKDGGAVDKLLSNEAGYNASVNEAIKHLEGAGSAATGATRATGGLTESSYNTTTGQWGAPQQVGTAPKVSGVGEPQPVKIPEGATTGPKGEIIQQDGTAIDPSTGQVVGRVVQGAAGAFMVYAGYNRFKDGDKLGGGLEMAAGASTLANASGHLSSSVAGPIGAVYGAYELGNMALNAGDMHKGDTGGMAARGAMGGAAIGTAILPGVGTAIGAAAGGLYGATLGATASGKDGGQVIRDQWRKNAQKSNLIGKDFKGTLADGSQIDWNNINGAQGSGVKDMQFSDPTVAHAVALGDMLATAQGARGTARANIAGELAKAAIANANGDTSVVDANMRHFASQLGLTPDLIHRNINEVAAKEVKKPEDAQLFHVALGNAARLFGQPGQSQSQQAQPPRKESNGMYRQSPGVYSNTPPPQQQMQPQPMQRPTPGNMPQLGPQPMPQPQQPQQPPRKESNGMYRLSPGVYSKNPPPQQGGFMALGDQNFQQNPQLQQQLLAMQQQGQLRGGR